MLCSGAFKIRGASNSIFALEDEQASKGVVTHSRFGASFIFIVLSAIFRTERHRYDDMVGWFLCSGNHAAAVALAAKLRGIPAHIVIPRNAPACKVENVKRYGGRILSGAMSALNREKLFVKESRRRPVILLVDRFTAVFPRQ